MRLPVSQQEPHTRPRALWGSSARQSARYEPGNRADSWCQPDEGDPDVFSRRYRTRRTKPRRTKDCGETIHPSPSRRIFDAMRLTPQSNDFNPGRESPAIAITPVARQQP